MTFGLQFSGLTRSELVTVMRTEPVPAGAGPRVVCTANLDHIVQLQKNQALRAAYAAAWSVTADGMPVFAYARLRQAGVGTRVTGSDLVADLLAELTPDRHRCFFVVSCAETREGVARALRARGFEDEAIAFALPPFGFEEDARYSDELAGLIRRHGATHLFLGVGAPKSEIWTHRYRDALGDCYVLNAGAGLDFASGVKRRAPVWMQRSGLEWLWRFGTEPRRLFRRYFVDSWSFVSAVYRDLTTPNDLVLDQSKRL